MPGGFFFGVDDSVYAADHRSHRRDGELGSGEGIKWRRRRRGAGFVEEERQLIQMAATFSPLEEDARFFGLGRCDEKKSKGSH